jgi:multidrug efflux pump subunit AcrA (membrane-fusion protein)
MKDSCPLAFRCVWRLAAATALLGHALGCGTDAAASDVKPRARGTAPLYEVRQGALQSQLLLYGRIDATSAERLIAPRTELWGLSIRALVEDGAPVKKGEIVAEFDNAFFVSRYTDNALSLDSEEYEYQRQLAASEATLAEKNFAVKRASIVLRKAELEANVPNDVYPLRVYQEKQLALDRARNALEKARSELTASTSAARLDLEVRRLSMERARKDLKDTELALSALSLRAPRDGHAFLGDNQRERRTYQVGDTVWPGNVVVTLPDTTEFQFVAQLSDVDDGQIEVGMKARCFVDAYPDRLLEGEVAAVSPVAQQPSRDSNRRYFLATLSLKHDPSSHLRPGMSARAEVLRQKVDNALLVPRHAIRQGEAGPEVTDADGQHHRIELTLCSHLDCAVTGPLEPGMRLRGAR